MIALRAGSDLLKYGTFKPLFGNRRVMAYQRELNGESLTVVLNFSGRKARVPFAGNVLAGNLGTAVFHGLLQPYEAVILTSSKENML